MKFFLGLIYSLGHGCHVMLLSKSDLIIISTIESDFRLTCTYLVCCLLCIHPIVCLLCIHPIFVYCVFTLLFVHCVFTLIFAYCVFIPYCIFTLLFVHCVLTLVFVYCVFTLGLYIFHYPTTCNTYLLCRHHHTIMSVPNSTTILTVSHKL